MVIDYRPNLHIVPDNIKLSFGSGKDSQIYYDGSDTFWDLQAVGTGGLMLALADSFPSPDSGLHIWNGSAGAVSAEAGAEFIIETDGNARIQFLTPNSANAFILFGDADSNLSALFGYSHANNRFDFRFEGATRLLYSANTFQFQEETTLGTTAGDLILDPSGDVDLNTNAVKSGQTNGGVIESNELTLADAGKGQLVAGDANAHALVLIFDQTNTTFAMYLLDGGDNSVSEIHDPSTSYTPTEDNDTTTNIYWDAGNSRYEINNETGAQATYTAWVLRV